MESTPISSLVPPTVKTATRSRNSKKVTIDHYDEFRSKKTSTIVGVAKPKRHCWWDRNAFSGEPISVPIAHRPKTIRKQCTTQSQNYNFVICEPVQSEKDRFDSVGSFCSPQCALAFIKDNSHDPLYRRSEFQLKYLFHEPFVAAPHWKMLNQYGGHLTISEFRKTFSNIVKGSVYKNIESTMVGMVFEEVFRI